MAGQQELRSLLAAGEITLVDGDATPSASVAKVLSQGAVATPLLVTTADHPLLTSAIVDSFCRRALEGGADVGVGLVSARLVRETFPDGQRTHLRFHEDSYCGCNLYALVTQKSARAPQFWVRIEAYRKQPWRMIGFIGIGARFPCALEARIHLGWIELGFVSRITLLLTRVATELGSVIRSRFKQGLIRRAGLQIRFLTFFRLMLGGFF